MGLSVLFAESYLNTNVRIEDDLPPGCHCFFVGDGSALTLISGSLITTVAATTAFKLAGFHFFLPAEDKNKVPFFIDQTEITGENEALVKALEKCITIRLIDHSHKDSHALIHNRSSITKLAEVDEYSAVGVYYTSDEGAKPLLIAGPFKINLKPQLVKKVKKNVVVVIPSEDFLNEQFEGKYSLDLRLNLVGAEESQPGEGNGLAYAKLKVEVDKEVEEQESTCQYTKEEKRLKKNAENIPTAFTFKLKNENKNLDLYIWVAD